jgi:hypothetical protein
MLTLFDALKSCRQVLLAGENNYTWARLILQSLNNLVLFQMDSNVHLIYNLVRHSDAIFAVAALRLDVDGQADSNAGRDPRWIPTPPWFQHVKAELPTSVLVLLVQVRSLLARLSQPSP